MSASTFPQDRRASGLVSSTPTTTALAEQTVRILVLPREDDRPLFYFEPTNEDAAGRNALQVKSGTDGGLRGWVGRVLGRVRHLEQHVPGWLQSPLIWLKSRLPADERLLMALRRADTVILLHPTYMAPEAVRDSWKGYLESRLQRRMGWLIFHLILFVPSIMLAVLPGPNVIGYWVTYRLVANGLALYSVIRASNPRMTPQTTPSEELDGPIFSDRAEAERIARRFQLHGLRRRNKRARVFARLRRRRRHAAKAPSNDE